MNFIYCYLSKKSAYIKSLFIVLFIPKLIFGQFEIKISESSYADLNVKFTRSSYADIDIRFVESEYLADFTVGFTNTKYNATVVISKSYNADLDVKITNSSYADLDVKITESSYSDVDMMIKKSGYVDYLIYSESYLDKNEIIIACLPIIKAFAYDKINEEKIPLFFNDCGKILEPEYETFISGEYEGWNFDNAIYELDNGLSVSSNTYTYTYKYRPKIKLFYCDGWYASIDGGKLESVIVYK